MKNALLTGRALSRIPRLHVMSGFTVSELMIAGTLAAFVLVTVVQFTVSDGNLSRTNTSVVQVKENGQFALNFLKENVTQSGYYGCLEPTFNSLDNVGSINWNYENYVSPVANDIASTNLTQTSLRGFELSHSGIWSPDLAADSYNNDIEDFINGGLKPKPINGSDVIAIQYAGHDENDIAELVDSMSVYADPITVADSDFGQLDFSLGDLIYVGNCTSGDVFRLSGSFTPFSGMVSMSHGSTDNASSDLNNLYSSDEENVVRRFYNKIIYIADTGFQSENGDKVLGLYQKSFNEASSVPELIIEGIENMQILYGIRMGSGSNNINFISASDASFDESARMRVVAIKIGLLTKGSTNHRLNNDNDVYFLPGEDIGLTTTVKHTGGKSLRKVFNTTLYLRNRA